MISIVLYGRNDNYGYNLHKRAALSLNCMAEVLSDPEDEILFVDYNTPDDFPTFPEAIEDTLTDKARKHLRIFRVRPAVHERFASLTHLKALEPVARNVAVRRSNPRNRWILSTNTDMIFVPRHAGSLTDMVRDLPKGYYGIPRFEIPEALWETFDRRDAKGVIEQVGRLGWDFHLNEIVYGEAEAIKYDGPGDFQLIERSDLFDIHGFDEAMLLGWHVDSNIAKRLHLIYGKIGDLVDQVFGYHCDHTRQVTPAHKQGAAQNSIKIFVDDVVSTCLKQQEESWGCANDKIEEIRLNAKTSQIYFAGLRDVIGKPMDVPSEANYNKKAFDDVSYDPRHVLPFLMDLFVSAPRNSSVAWFGYNPTTFKLFCNMWKVLGFSGRVMIPEDSAEYLAVDADDCVDVADSAHMQRDASTFVFDFAKSGGAALGSAANLCDNDLAGCLTRYFHWVVNVEQTRNERNVSPRRVVAINAVHNRFESLVCSNLGAAQTPFSARMRHGFVNPAPAAPTAASAKATPTPKVSWLHLMTPGIAGERYRKGIRSFTGKMGHMVFGPYVYLNPGRYRLTVALKPGNFSLGTLWNLLRPRRKPPAVCEVVSGDRYLIQRNIYGHSLLYKYGLRRSRHVLEFSIDGNSDAETPPSSVECRIWTHGKLDLRLYAVELERIMRA